MAIHRKLEGFQALQDWLVATANDQIACIDDNDEEGRFAYLSSFQNKFKPLVTPQYLERGRRGIYLCSAMAMSISVRIA